PRACQLVTPGARVNLRAADLGGPFPLGGKSGGPIVKRVLACAALAVVLLAAPAAAQQYPPAVNSLTISDTTPTPGQPITIEGRTFAAGSTVTVAMVSDPVTLGTAVADDQGVFTLQSPITFATALGQHTLTAAGQAPDGSALFA